MAHDVLHCDMGSMCCMWFVHNCALATNICVGDSSQHLEEIFKKCELRFSIRLLLLLLSFCVFNYLTLFVFSSLVESADLDQYCLLQRAQLPSVGCAVQVSFCVTGQCMAD